ncbi:L,D-transpeptidase family protein [Pseudooceanicola sp.]|uniref:L,D-transpeptidase family protein n=1 Tax=Pseudooceanicola sp. TaxID=1914328 RepID=UPI002627909E|nr:L,D-transpeptidase family protein [Pseudooceanicola sp.]MDF1855721.1 L,D-transpeptidase family protein [Pseudooceanicola sp.]
MTPADLVLTPRGVRFLGQYWPCTLGRGGRVSDKREGDGGTPVGTHRIVGMLYRADRIARPANWAEPIGPRDLWCDISGHADYNQLVQVPIRGSRERLRRGDPLYDIVLVTDWNWPLAEAGRGSAIFLHQWRRPGFPTAGCIGFRRDHLRWIAAAIQPGSRLIVPA